MEQNEQVNNHVAAVLGASAQMAAALTGLTPEEQEAAILALVSALNRPDLARKLTTPIEERGQVPIQVITPTTNGSRGRNNPPRNRGPTGPRAVRLCHGRNHADLERLKGDLDRLNRQWTLSPPDGIPMVEMTHLRQARQFIQDCQSWINKGFWRSFLGNNQRSTAEPPEPDWFRDFISDRIGEDNQ